jgi:hypothetical protein
VRGDEKLTAFIELKSAIRGCSEWVDKLARLSQNSLTLKKDLNPG